MPACKKTYAIGQRFTAVIYTSQIKITPSRCTANHGAITNISVTNATQYQWFDINKNPLATNRDLINVPSGLYTLVVTADYYLIDLKTPECFGKISGSLTLIR